MVHLRRGSKDQKDVDDEVGAEDVGDLAETMVFKNFIIEELVIENELGRMHSREDEDVV